jgi:heat shock protein HslJ
MRRSIFIVILSIVQICCISSKSVSNNKTTIEGNWQLTTITESNIDFGKLYPGEIPMLIVDLKNNSFAGNNSCNRYNGTIELDKNNVKFDGSKTAMTLMACPGDGDTVFMKTLGEIDRYKVSKDGNKLILYLGNVEKMHFIRK